MKLAIIAVPIISAASAIASSVAWNVVYVSYVDEHGQTVVAVRIPDDKTHVSYDDWPYFHHESTFYIGIETSNGIASLISNPLGVFVLTSTPEAWLPASRGDRVDASTVFDQGDGQYFYNDLLGNANPSPDGKGSPAMLEVGEIGYFKIAVQDEEQYFNYLDIFHDSGQPDFIPDTYYGWVSYTVDARGNLTFIESAIGLNGQSMVVGAIPEPSCALLLLFGTAALASCGVRRDSV